MKCVSFSAESAKLTLTNFNNIKNYEIKKTLMGVPREKKTLKEECQFIVGMMKVYFILRIV